MLTVLILIHLMLVLAMVGVVLLQKSEGGGLVSSTSGFLTGRGTANVLTRTTAFLAIGFFVTSLTLSQCAGHAGSAGGLADRPAQPKRPRRPRSAAGQRAGQRPGGAERAAGASIEIGRNHAGSERRASCNKGGGISGAA